MSAGLPSLSSHIVTKILAEQGSDESTKKGQWILVRGGKEGKTAANCMMAREPIVLAPNRPSVPYLHVLFVPCHIHRAIVTSHPKPY